jgi:hypothetical protein
MLVITDAYAKRDSDLLSILKEHAAEARQCLIGLVDRKRLHLSPVARKTPARSGVKLAQDGEPRTMLKIHYALPSDRFDID